MIGNRGENTRPEVALRSELHRRGLRFRLGHRIGEGRSAPRPDVVFAAERIAVFLDGCYWHGCPEHGTRPRTNTSYWDAKIAANKARDARHNATLEIGGWQVLRVWEHDDPRAAAARIEDAVRARRLQL
jgi:DNA mismatch endonuclease (patch repair protein)